jgi:hypothetical protein
LSESGTKLPISDVLATVATGDNPDFIGDRGRFQITASTMVMTALRPMRFTRRPRMRRATLFPDQFPQTIFRRAIWLGVKAWLGNWVA